MINKKLIHFNQVDTFKERQNEVPEHSIVFIKDSCEINTRNDSWKWVNWGELKTPFIKSIESKAGDVCLYDTIKCIKVIIPISEINSIDHSRFEPVGVVTVPGTHNVYGDGSCGIVSLQHMNFNNPTTGGAPGVSLYFGPQANLTLMDYTKVVVYTATRALTTNNFGYLCKNGVWNYETIQIPDPHNSDGSRNPEYYSTTGYTNSSYNALSDFKGRSNTNVILAKRGAKDYSTWTLTNTTANYPAASACDLYRTPGTLQGDWYLPSCGELGYIMSRWNEINDSIDAINSIWGNAYRLVDANGYWTSTENATRNQRYVHMSNGVGYSNKDTAYSTVAFTKISC